MDYKKFFANNKLMALVYNIFFSIILIAGAVFVWIITDDGGFQSIIKEIENQGFELSMLALYMVFAHVSSASMALNKAIIDEDDESEELKEKTKKSEELDNELSDIRQVHLFLDDYNKSRFDRLQKKANEAAVKRLRLKLYKKDVETKHNKTIDRINKLKQKRPKFYRTRLTILHVKKLILAHQKRVEEKIAKIELGKMNVKVKRFKEIKAKQLATYNSQKYKDADNPKLAPTIKKRTYTRSFFTSMTINLISSFGIFVALQSIFDYTAWGALAIFLVFFMFFIFFKYLLEYVRGRKSYRNEMLSVLREKIDIKNKCKQFINNNDRIKAFKAAKITTKHTQN